jgi:hypothetical protein
MAKILSSRLVVTMAIITLLAAGCDLSSISKLPFLPASPPATVQAVTPTQVVAAMTPVLPTYTPMPMPTPTATAVIPPTPQPIVMATLPPTVEARATPTSPPAITPTAVSMMGTTGGEMSPLGQGAASPATQEELLVNGGFEAGFAGMGVASGWEGFHNGSADFGWYDDSWPPVVIEGAHAQLMEIARATLSDRYIGIYQRVPVAPGQAYSLTVQGLIRSTEGNIAESDWGYRMEVGIDYNGGTNWQAIGDWVELPWDEQPRVMEVFTKSVYSTILTAQSPSLTLFIRGHKKWATPGEGDFDVDGVSLVGPVQALAAPLAEAPTVAAPAEPTSQLPTTGGEIEGPSSGVSTRLIASIVLLLLMCLSAAWAALRHHRARIE